VNKIELSDDDDDDSYDGIESLQKFDDDLKKEYLEAIHPESKQYNYNEIESLCKIVRNSDGDIVDELHKTQCWISKYEYTRIIGQRTKQLNQGVKPFINVPSNIINNDIIAEMEMKEKKLPFIIRRPLPNGGSEFWKLKDLELISY
jgi:DNA-directed RNA polymerase I, II, and III subunit RPABC2